ncbi:MAG: hypothetical protein A2X72_11690 [Burkholderiales bacterium GWF1_66_17]|nr:MAG: hypothetical protein A2X73_12325 [Burkholderiales bacterium GWE1_65_30]OGA90625.1 MAG: hypothetical protein A2X72_11690 [Burkholderiales bacterium GWF1_66_17]
MVALKITTSYLLETWFTIQSPVVLRFKWKLCGRRFGVMDMDMEPVKAGVRLVVQGNVGEPT